MKKLLQNYGGKLNKNVTFDSIYMFDKNSNIIDSDEYINDHLNQINYNKTKIGLYNTDTKVFKIFKNKNCFTDKQLFDIILRFEKKSRPLYDNRHIYFEGLTRITKHNNLYKKINPNNENFDIYIIFWGS